ncbi:hypothetical protein [Changchengzhania lutea]|uniref:hypothetical protein n=1 Tax=Changchengzhania lutea TaxID=2049305 RepID=UPI00115D0CC0|nr:hypothetical protein [Changchengzhania lutea]
MNSQKLYCIIFLIILNSCGGKDKTTTSATSTIEKGIAIILSSNELLGLVQKQTFKYFWGFSEFTSGMAGERTQTPIMVTMEASGWCFMFSKNN